MHQQRYMASSSCTARVFYAAWGRGVLYITLLVTLFLFCLPVLIFFGHRFTPPKVILWILLLLPVVILGSSALFAAFSYEITDTHLLIRRLLWKTSIPLPRDVTAEFEPNAMKGSLRIFGNGGIFGFYGWFWSTRLGRYSAYVTDMSRSVIIRMGEKTIVVSPDHPDEFVELMRLFRKQSQQ